MSATPLKDLSAQDLTLSLTNQYARKTVSALPGGEPTQQRVKAIESKLSEQEKDLSEIQKAMEEVKKET